MSKLKALAIAIMLAAISACASSPKKPETPTPPTPPAATNIAGDWLFTVETPQGSIDANMTVVQNGKDITGILDSSMGRVDYTGTIDGNQVKFSYGIEQFGAPAGTRLEYMGTVDNNTMKGKANFAGMSEGTWSANRR